MQRGLAAVHFAGVQGFQDLKGPEDYQLRRVLQVSKAAEDTGERVETLEDEEILDPKEIKGLQDVQGSRVRREPEDFLDIRENMELMGLLDSMGKRVFMDFLEKREKKVIQDPRAAQVPEAPLGDTGRRASQGTLVIQDEIVTSKDKRAPEENKEDKVEPDRKERKAVLIPEEAGAEKARGGSRAPRGCREILELKVHRELRDYKAHRG